MAPPMKPSREEMLATTFNAKLARQGAKTRKLAESRDVNTLPDPKTYAAVMGLLGERPDEMGFSVAHPKYKEIMDVADPAFALGTAAQVVPLVKPAGQAVRGAAKVLAPKAGQMVMDAAQATGMPVYGLGVVKPRGGNWLSETEGRIKSMSPYADLSKSIDTMKARIASAENAGASPRSLEMMKGDLQALERDQAVNNWTTRNLGNYIKKEMGTPDDPVRKLAEEGIVHAPHGDFIEADSGSALAAKRTGLGFPAEGMGKSPEAKAWEELSDFAIKDTQAKNIQGADEGHRMYEAARARADAVHADIDQKFDEMVKSSMSPEEAAKMMRLPFKNKAQTLGREGEYEAALGEATKMFQSANAGKVDVLEANPWVSKLDPEERLYTGYFGDLGFDHIIDVLREDVRAGRIRPEQLSKVSMDQAVRRTYEYDIEMAKKMNQAATASMEGFPVHKEYPEGYKWIELAMPKGLKLPEGYSVKPDPITNRKTGAVDTNSYRLVDPEGNLIGWGQSEEEAISSGLGEKQLAEALKYEGDTMGHCVGGYCPDVVSGRSRIFSLRDPKGMPHVTIEVRPKAGAPRHDEVLREMKASGLNVENMSEPDYDVAYTKALEKLKQNRPPEIAQIKGKQNKAPIEDYLPYVQDFVRGGEWSSVGDLLNAGMREVHHESDLAKAMQSQGLQVPRYITNSEMSDLLKTHKLGLYSWQKAEGGAVNASGMKDGGEVKMKEGGIKETPVKNKAAHGMSQALGAVHKFASEPFGYKNPPGEMISEMLGIPATARTLDRMGYGEPLTTGKGMTTKPKADTMDALMAVAPFVPITKGMPVGAVVKPKGGNWLTGDIEKSLKRLKSPYDPDVGLEDLRQMREQHGELPAYARDEQTMLQAKAINNWVDRNLTNFIKNQMATPDDPVRKLAEEGVLHFQPQDVFLSPDTAFTRTKGGYPRHGLGKSQLAIDWEVLSDKPVGVGTTGEMMNAGKGEPWMEKVDPFTRVHDIAPLDQLNMTRDLGFDHIIDVLKEDLATGRIRPEQLSKVSMEQAVRRTYEYDQELAKKMAEARLVAREGLPVYKEYPEGFRWVELNKPGAFAQESEAMGHSVRGYEPPTGHPDWVEGSGDAGSLGYGHGGWEAIKSGKAKVYSLVDPKGNSHVTVEVGKGRKNVSPSEFYHSKDVPQSLLQKINEAEKAGYLDDIGAFDDFVQSSQEYQDFLKSGPLQITQVKGKQNAAPKPEYLPFVQDFVRSSGMPVERDLQNTGLRDMNRYEPLRKYLENKGTKFERYIPEEEFKSHEDDFLMDRLYPKDDPDYAPPTKGMKAGGEVKMGVGGLLSKAAKAMKGAQEILPAAEREENLRKFLETSKIKDRLYHITPEDITEFKPGGNNPKRSGPATWLTPEKEFQPAAHSVSLTDEQNRTHPISGPKAKFRSGTNVMPVHAQAKAPMVLDDKDMLDWARASYAGGSNEFPYIMHPEWAKEISKDYDSILLADPFGRGDPYEVIMFEPNKIKSAIGNRGTYDVNEADINKANGGEVKMGVGGLLALGKGAQKADKASKTIRASEAFGSHEGLPVYITQADRTKVGEGFLGGPGFSSLQLTSEPHREAMAAWGVKNPGTAKTIIGDPSMGENPLFTTMIGSPTQHQSNQMVFDKLYRAFKAEAKKGNLPDELRYMINDKLAKAVDKEGKNIFPSNVDILDKNFHKMADTFDRRSIAGHLMGGVGIGGKKGQIIDYDKLIKQTTDPLLIDAPSGAIGPRAFTLDKNVIERPDLHPAFPTILTGQDLGVAFEPVPRELFMQDFINKVRAEKGRDPGYMDYVRGRPPSQFISEDWLTSLQKKGHKKGGLLKVKRKK